MAKPWEKYRQPDPYASDPYAISGPERQPTPVTPNQDALDAANIDRIRTEQAKTRAETDRIRAQPDPGDINPADPKNRSRIATLNSLAEQLARVEHLYQQTIEPTSGVSGFLDFLPTEANRQFDAASAGLAEQGLAAFRVPGVGAQSDTELRQFVQANKPSASDYDVTIEEKLRQLRARIEATRQQYGLPPMDGGARSDDRQDAPPAVTGGKPPAGPQGMDRTDRMMGSGSADQVSLARGDYRKDNDPNLVGVNEQIQKMIMGGANAREILEYYRSVGGKNPLHMGRLNEAIQWRKQNPRTKVAPTVDVDNMLVPLTSFQQFRNNMGQSAPGAYAINAGDAVTFGTLDNMTDNPALTRAGMDQVRQQNPGSSLAGTITGAALASGASELGVGMGAAKLAGGRVLPRFFAPVVGDAAYGAGYGAGTADEGSRLWGAARGAGASVAGGVAGRKVASAGGRALTGTRDATTRYLREQGIPQTIGQIAGRGGVLGKGVKRIEDALESIPILGAAIRQRRAEGVEGFNRAAFREALEPIPPAAVSAVAEEGVEQARGAVGGAYTEALSGVAVKADPTFVKDMKRAMTAGQRLHSETAEDFEKIIEDQIAPAFAKGPLSGEEYQAIRQALRGERAAWKGRPRGHQYGQALRQVEGALEALVRRRAPGVVQGLNRADAANRGVSVVRDAVSRGKNAEAGGIFTPAQLGMAAEANAKKFGGKHATTERPFFDLQRAGQQVLPSTVPNSGTTDRALAAGVLALPGVVSGGAASQGWIDPETAALMTALGLPFTKAGQAAFQRILIDRPEVVRRLGQKVLDRKPVGGLLGAGAALSTLPAQ